jgi:hypothetical protein
VPKRTRKRDLETLEETVREPLAAAWVQGWYASRDPEFDNVSREEVESAARSYADGYLDALAGRPPKEFGEE